MGALAGSSQAGEPVSFRAEVMAVLSKAGCNSGPCHGNANGKAGFKLSLRGEDAEFDFIALARDQGGRRLDTVAPAESLALMKATAQLPHEGGRRFEVGSWEYNTLRDWIAQGAWDDRDQAPQLVKLVVHPSDWTVLEAGESIQLKVMAHFVSGVERDVTAVAVYESSNPLVTVTPSGVAHGEGVGEATVLARFLGEQRPIRLAFARKDPSFAWDPQPESNFIDQHVFTKLKQIRVNPSPLAGDEVFARRAYLDLLGFPPSAAEARSFVFDTTPGKRVQLVDALLKRPEFADYWALKWSDLLGIEERPLDRKGVETFHRWIREAFATGKPLDQFAREILSARGSSYLNPPANFYRANRTPTARSEAVAQVFLGTRLQCAQCHNHPFDRWTQADYQAWAGVFSRVQYRVLENRRRDSNDSHEFKGEQIIFRGSKPALLKHPRTGAEVPARLLGDKEPLGGTGEDELESLATWLTSRDNPFFARAQANRVWHHLLGRGLVEPLDDFRASNPASHPELLEQLAREFADSGFDMRRLIRTIMSSTTYQLSALPNETNGEDDANYARANIRRLDAEVLLDCMSAFSGVPLEFAGFPKGTRATQIGLTLPERRNKKSAALENFLAEFGKPPRLLPSECERSSEPTMTQAFQLLSGETPQRLISSPENSLARLTAAGGSPSVWLEELFWSGLSRGPSDAERAAFESHFEGREPRAALEDMMWALVNSKEFVFRH